MLESEASLGWQETQDPPQEVALDIKLSYIYKVSQTFLSCLSTKCWGATQPFLPLHQVLGCNPALLSSLAGQHHQGPAVNQLSTTVGSVVAPVPMLLKACSLPVTASIAKEVYREGSPLVTREQVPQSLLSL